jgi:heavy metal translocating P-type ATPase
LKTSSKSASAGSVVICRTDAASCDDLDLVQSRSWLRIAVACVFAGQGMMFSLALNMTPPPFGSTAYKVLHGGLIFASFIVVVFLGGPLFRSTLSMLRSRRLSIEGLFTLSLLGAFVGSVVSSVTGEGGVYYEVVSIVIAIYTVGRLLSERSQSKLKTETDAVRETYDQAQRIVCSNDLEWVAVRDISIGDRVRVDPGMAFTVDGIVLEGAGFVRETSLTGEPSAVVRRKGDRVRAGTWSEDGSFTVEVAVVWGERELDQILATVEDGAGRVSEMQTQANRLIQFFLPVVAGVSVATAVYWSVFGTWIEAVLNSMAVLLVACPCALGLATPVAIWNGLLRLSKLGLVSRDGALIDALAQTKQVFFDKTGTLSEATLRVSEQWVAEDWQAKRSKVFAMVRAVESRLTHPLAKSLVAGLPETDTSVEVCDWELLPGRGVQASCQLSDTERNTVQIGSHELATDEVELKAAMAALKDREGKPVFVWVEGTLAAIFVLRERIRSGVEGLWSALEGLSIEATVLTGDPEPKMDVPISVMVHQGMRAAEKSALIEQANSAGKYPIFVGDGINDSPGMSHAVASIAMGSGADLTQSAASGRLISDDLAVLPEAIQVCRGIYKRLRGNLIYAAVYNVIGMCLAACGLLHPIIAAIIMLVSSFLVTARSLR